MMQIHFDKYQATGNDFILLDNRDERYSNLNREQIKRLCDRRFGVGADGLMMLNAKEGYDFEMKYFNADGDIGSMCGNGGRCIVAFANKSGISKDRYFFLAYDGDHFAKLREESVSLKMNPVTEVHKDGDAFVLDTGSPHYVLPVDDIMGIDVYAEGRKIRYSDLYKEAGINVNFVQQQGAKSLFVRTYERGVEDETYSCGTGVTASAIAFAVDEGEHVFDIVTKGGKLEVSYRRIQGHFDDIWLTGSAEFVFSGEINI